MPNKGHKYTAEQRANVSRGHLGQIAWNKGMGGCKRGHDPALYSCGPSGVYVCLGCKRLNGSRYRAANKEAILFKNRIARYALSLAVFEALWIAQNGACAICQISFEQQEYRIDHDHITGAVRGFLCASCNTGLGLFKDAPHILVNAMAYLACPPAQSLDEEKITSEVPREQQVLFLVESVDDD